MSQVGSPEIQLPANLGYQPEFPQYNVEYSQCVICLEVISHESLKPVKIHLGMKLTSHINKPLELFEPKEGELQSQKKAASEKLKTVFCLPVYRGPPLCFSTMDSATCIP